MRSKSSNQSDPGHRRFLGAAALTIGAVQAGIFRSDRAVQRGKTGGGPRNQTGDLHVVHLAEAN